MTDTVETTKQLSPQEYKIELLNIYRKLMEKKLPNVAGDAGALDEVSANYKSWLANQIELLLGGNPGSVSSFNDEETQILKMFAQGLLTKAAKGSAPAPEAPEPSKLRTNIIPKPISDSDRAIMARARPLKEPGDSAKSGDLISQLERLQNTKTWMDGE